MWGHGNPLGQRGVCIARTAWPQLVVGSNGYYRLRSLWYVLVRCLYVKTECVPRYFNEMVVFIIVYSVCVCVCVCVCEYVSAQLV